MKRPPLSHRVPQAFTSPQGFSLIEVIVALGISSVLLGLVFFPLGESSKVDSGVTARQFMAGYREELLQTIRHQASWQSTVDATAENPSLQCLKNKTDCIAFRNVLPRGTRITLFERSVDGAVSIKNDSRDPAAGFTKAGRPCSSFNASTPSNECPIRVVLSWLPQCGNLGPGQPCINPEILILASFQISSDDPALKSLNTTSFGFRVYRSAKTETLKPYCDALGGTFSSGATDSTSDDTCTLGAFTTCPNGHTVVGFHSNGTPNCQPISAVVSCPQPGPPNYEPVFLQGVDANGNVICAPCP